MRNSATLFCLPLLSVALSAAAQQTLPLWPHNTPEPAQTTAPEVDVTKPSDALISGHRTSRLTNVTHPTLTVYRPLGHVKNTGVAALVFPGGAYIRLAWEGEGTDTCHWLNSIGVTCLLVKYRVPEQGHYPENYADLEDAQQAMRLARAHAVEWGIDPAKIGAVGFSAGGNLAALMSTHPDDHHVESTPAASDADLTKDARLNFAIVVYPAYLIVAPENTQLDPVYKPNTFTPPTFLIQAENDKGYGKNAPVYFQALADAKVPAELHMYATGGHGFGIHPTGAPEENWTALATAWLRSINMLPREAPRSLDSPASTGGNGATNIANCPPPNANQTRPDPNARQPATLDPNCPTQ